MGRGAQGRLGIRDQMEAGSLDRFKRAAESVEERGQLGL